MLVVRALLALIALGNVFFGAFALVATDKVAAFIRLMPEAPQAHGEMRAIFGGLVLALAALVAAGAMDPGKYGRWLSAAGLIFAGLALGRVVSLIADGIVTYTLVALVLEGGAAALCWYGARACAGLTSAEA